MELLSNHFNKDQLINDFKVAVTDAEALLLATANVGGEKVAEIRSRAEESLKIAKNRMVNAQEALVAKTKATAKMTDVYVHENPWKAIGFAASVGVVIGLLMSRR
ncbi:MAG: DUF883 domain-containing protein [Methylotenera sp.]|nr:DUF883 domain-containing protein [Methylotenera sp.]